MLVWWSPPGASLGGELKAAAPSVRDLLGPDARPTICSDRGGSSPKLFAELVAMGFDILTYRKGPLLPEPRAAFSAYQVTGRFGHGAEYLLADRAVRIYFDNRRHYFACRQVTRLDLASAANAGAPEYPDWSHNLVLDPEVVIEVGDTTSTATAVVLSGAQREALLERFESKYPVSASYQGTDELHALMVDYACGYPPEHLARKGWRDNLVRWASTLFDGYRRHPWAAHVPLSRVPPTPTQTAWLEAGLRCISGTELIDPQRFPEVSAVAATGAFDDQAGIDGELSYGLERILDGVEHLLQREHATPANKSARQQRPRMA